MNHDVLLYEKKIFWEEEKKKNTIKGDRGKKSIILKGLGVENFNQKNKKLKKLKRAFWSKCVLLQKINI